MKVPQSYAEEMEREADHSIYYRRPKFAGAPTNVEMAAYSSQCRRAEAVDRGMQSFLDNFDDFLEALSCPTL